MSDKAVDRILAEALKAVNDAELPDELRAIGFKKAVDMIAAKAGVPSGGPPAPTRPASAGGGGPAIGDTDEKSIERIAAKLSMEVDLVSDVFHVEDGEPRLSVAPSKLSSTKRVAVQQVSLLIAAARQSGGWDNQWTLLTELRKVAQDYSLHDGNWAGIVAGMGNVFQYSGSGNDRKVKVNRKGWEDTPGTVRAVLGET
jgi:hypothetical protein